MEQIVKKELILINPSVSNYIIRFVLWLVVRRRLPHSLSVLSALTPPDYKIKILNQGLLWLRKNFPKGALVGITCITSSAPNAYKLAQRARKVGAYVVMGGPHVSVLPEEALQYCDSIVIGEAESVWAEVIKDFESKALKKIYHGQPLEDFFSPVNEYYLRLNPRILKRTGITISRGCKYHCDFCARPFGGPRYIAIEQVIGIVKRIKKVSRVPFIEFSENNIFSDPVYAKQLFKELAPLNIRWGAPCSIDIAFDEEALSLAKQSGCRILFIGFETIYPNKFEKTSAGKITSTRDYVKAVKKIKSYGIKIIGAFMVGFDHYTHPDYIKLLLFLISTFVRSRFWWISMTMVTPYPGTELFARLKKEARIRSYDWGKYDLLFHVVFKPKNMGAFSLLLWFIIIRAIAVVCSTLGLSIIILFNVLPKILPYMYKHFLPFVLGMPGVTLTMGNIFRIFSALIKEIFRVY